MRSSSTPEQHPGRQKRRKSFKKRLLELLENQSIEFIGTVIAVAVIAAVSALVKRFIGAVKFFDLIPVQWVFDLAHIVMIGRLVWGIIKGFNEE